MNEEYQREFERFNVDVTGHVVRVLRDEGLYRHLRCWSGSYAYSFDIITWPGYLCYCGDMGSFVFSRLPDMFEFFRGRLTAMIDLGYLAEKAVAADRHDGITSYSEARFRSCVKADFDAFVESEDLPPEQAAELWQSITDDVLSSSDNRQDGVRAAGEFRWGRDLRARGREVFPDFWEHRLDEYTGRFWWCCYAIPWAIERYDAQAVEGATACAG